MAKKRVSVITTVYNEADAIGPLLQSLLDQSRDPEEVIICDAGSDDGTVRIIKEWIEEGFPGKLIVVRGANRARGRNAAIKEAKGEVIASIDAGCSAARDWLSKLVAPFEEDDPPEVVAGYYEPDPATPLEEAIAVATVPDPVEVDPESFLPSGRSVAFLRSAWQRVGGYPEQVEFAEDTEFGLKLKAAGYRFRFVPEAQVRWRMRGNLWAVYRQFLSYARSDGELGLWFTHYRKAYFGLLLALTLAVLAWINWRPAPWLLIGLLAAYWARYSVRARRRGAEWFAALVSPGVNLIVDSAHLIGYTKGFMRYRSQPAPLPQGRPLSIAQVTYTYRPVTGGADVYVAQLEELITGAGHRHTVYQRTVAKKTTGVRFVPNPLRNKPLEFWTQALGLVRLRRKLLAHDVVICHYPHYLLMVDFLSGWARRPVRVGLSHGVFWDEAPGSPRSFLKALVAKLAFRRAHLYIANDTHFLRAMGMTAEPQERPHTPISPGVWFIPNGVDTKKFQPVDTLAEIAEKNAILVPRNLFRNRGVHLAIEAFAQFHPRHPETTLFIVGSEGQRSYVELLKREVETRGLRRSVVFYGPAPHDQLPAFYSSAQMTLIPSLCGEGTSLAALESMACGTATICTYVAGLRDLLGPHALPMVASLVELMEEVWPNRKEVGEHQRQIVLAQYSLEKWRDSWKRALSEVGVDLK